MSHAFESGTGLLAFIIHSFLENLSFGICDYVYEYKKNNQAFKERLLDLLFL